MDEIETVSDRRLYEDDFYAWSRHQAAVLRGMGSRSDLPNDLDLEHVAEEIEDVGSERLHAVESRMRLILVHLIKAAAVPAAEPRSPWAAEVVSFHFDLTARYSRSMAQNIDPENLWRKAARQATLAITERDVSFLSSTRCPLSLGDFLEDEFDHDDAVARVAALIPDGS